MKFLRRSIFILSVGFSCALLFILLSPKTVSATHGGGHGGGNCPDGSNWTIDTWGSSHPAGLIVRTYVGGNLTSGISWTLNSTAYSIWETDSSGSWHGNVSSKRFTTGGTIYCASESDQYTGVTVLGAGTRGGGLWGNWYGNHWVLSCRKIEDIYPDGTNPHTIPEDGTETFWISNVSSPGGPSGHWEANLGSAFTGFTVTNGTTVEIDLTWHVDAKPDLVVRNKDGGTSPKISGPTTVEIGQTVTYRARTKNIGDARAGSSTMRAWTTDSTNNADNFSVSAKDPGEISEVKEFKTSWNNTGTYSVHFKADYVQGDPNGVVDESNENNNEKSISVTVVLPLPTCTLTPQPIEIWRGETATLSWQTKNTESATLTRPAGTFPVSQLPDGERDVTPTETFTFIMNVKNDSGTGDCQTTIFVVDPLSCSLAVDPQLFPAGTTSRLSWTTTGLVKEASIDQGIGKIPKAEFATGSRDITPSTTTTYTMTVKGGNKVTRTNTCFVIAHVLPACTLSVLPTAIRPGETALLSWTTVNAQSGSISPQVGDITNQLDAGTRSVTAIGDLTFKLTVVNSEGTYVCEVTLHMLPICKIKAQPQAILRGQSSTLSWVTNPYTKSASIDNGVGDVSSLLPTGSTKVSPRVDTTYTMTVSNDWGETTCFVVVDIIFSPIISAARGTICDFVVLTVRVLSVSAFVIALFLFIFSGIRWIISRGDEQVLAKARSMMLSTGVGLTILVSAVSIILLIEYFFQVTIFTCPTF